MLAGRHHGTGRDNHFIFHHHTIEHHGAHANEASIAHSASMQHSLVANRDVIANLQAEPTGRVRAIMGHVEHHTILHASPRTDANRCYVAAHHSARPHGAVIADDHLADDDCRDVHVHPLT